MKRLTLLLAFVIGGITANGQLGTLNKSKTLETYKNKTGKELVFNSPKSLLIAVDSIPKNERGVIKLESKGVYRGNNGKGADIYAYTPDNMPVLKPDSTFYSNMPVGGRSMIVARPTNKEPKP